jgi:trans-2,3-dihydro-3-hydroxyanthranilate isomerase
MKTYSIKQVDAFTDRAYTGNPASVVMNAEGLSDEQMQLIAREMNNPETAFVIPSKSTDYDFELRWMTPTQEVNLCGHATIGAFHALTEEKMYGLGKNGNTTFRVKTKSGILPLTVQKTDEHTKIIFGLPLPTFEKYSGQTADLFAALGVPIEQHDNNFPMWISNNRYIFIPFVNREPLLKMKPDFHSLKQLSMRRNIIGFCAFTTETKYDTSKAHSRFFAPAVGIDEDPVTGTAQGALACYLYQNKRVQGEGLIPVTLEQGYQINRGGRVWAELDVKKSAIEAVRIGGYAVTILDGKIYVRE